MKFHWRWRMGTFWGYPDMSCHVLAKFLGMAVDVNESQELSPLTLCLNFGSWAGKLIELGNFPARFFDLLQYDQYVFWGKHGDDDTLSFVAVACFFFAWTSPDGCILLLVHLSFAKWCAPNAMCFLSKSYQLVRFSGLQLQQELPAKIISRSFCRVSPEFCNIFLIFRPVELLEDPWSLLLHHHDDASHVMADHHDYPIPSYETPPWYGHDSHKHVKIPY